MKVLRYTRCQIHVYHRCMSPLGDRLGDVRRRHGYTQEQLAERAGVAVSTLRKIERGARDGARLATLHQLARALDVSTSNLFEPSAPPSPEPVGDRRELDLMALRATLTPIPEEARPSSADDHDVLDIGTRVEAAWRMYHANSYAAVASQLPDILPAARRVPEHGVSALRLAGHLLIQFDQPDLAYHPITEGLSLAERAGDTMGAAALVNSLGWLFMRQGRLEDACTVAREMADRVEPKMSTATLEELSAWGWLLLRSSAAAVRDNQPAEAEEMLILASSAGRRVGAKAPGNDADKPGFSSRLVTMKRVEHMMIVGEPGKALQLAERIPASGYAPSSDVNRHRLDVAAACVAVRDRGGAFDILRQIRRDAPEWLEFQQYGRDVLERVLHQRIRPVPLELRELVDFMRLT